MGTSIGAGLEVHIGAGKGAWTIVASSELNERYIQISYLIQRLFPHSGLERGSSGNQASAVWLTIGGVAWERLKRRGQI